MSTLLLPKLENIISGHRINEDDAAWLRSLVSLAPAETAAVPVGWKLVPVEPTVPMLFQGARSLIDGQQDRHGSSWGDEAKLAFAAMLAASPQPPATHTDWLRVKRETVLFLIGMGDECFERPAGEVGAFWWRSRLIDGIDGGFDAIRGIPKESEHG